jgi:isopentenyl diphosphate isomerase/L-lactate dehydrogenase-like FMN-dependent dehydrogenase
MTGDQQPSVMPLRIAIDFDQTYTRAPEMWDKIIAIMKNHGHKVMCVTARQQTEENREEVKIPGVFTYFTGLQAKEKFLRDTYDVRVDIWIDDEPKYILQNR